MASFNRVILMGNLTRDPQLKYLPNNTAVCEFGMAINHRWRDKDGNQREDVCFVDFSAFGRQGEVINQYMTKGRSMLVEGRLKYDTWTSQDGTKRSKHSVVVENFSFTGGRGEGGGDGPRGGGERGADSGSGEMGDAGGYSQGGRDYGADRGRGRDSGGGRSAGPARGAAVPPAAGTGSGDYAGDDSPPASSDDIPF